MDRLVGRLAFVFIAAFPFLTLAADPEVDAAALVRRINAEEFKIHDFDSFSIRMETVVTRTPELIEKGRAELTTKFPKMEISEKRFSNLRPRVTGYVDFSYDLKRLRFHRFEQDVSLDLRVWDGEKEIYHSKYFTHEQEQFGFVLLDGMKQLGYYFYNQGLPWLEVGIHPFWWKNSERGSFYRPFPDDFEVVKEDECEGKACYVVANVWSHPTELSRVFLWIGKEDGRLYGKFVPRDLDDTRNILDQMSGGMFAKGKYKEWYSTLSYSEQDLIGKRVFEKEFPGVNVRPTTFFDDYREISPGFFIPYVVRVVAYPTPADHLPLDVPYYEKINRVLDVKVNPTLPDELFRIEFQEGVDVADQRMTPTLHYKYKSNMTKEDMEAALAARQKQIEEWAAREKDYKRSIGQKATEFKKASVWFNHSPINFEKDLKGKIVLLDFWDVNCGPCYNDLALLSDLKLEDNKSGVQLIGVHCSMKSKEEIQKVLDAQKIKYPVCTDFYAPWEKMALRGYLAKSYGVPFMPFAVVIDADGKVAEAGPLREVLPKAFELARKLTAQTAKDQASAALK